MSKQYYLGVETQVKYLQYYVQTTPPATESTVWSASGGDAWSYQSFIFEKFGFFWIRKFYRKTYGSTMTLVHRSQKHLYRYSSVVRGNFSHLKGSDLFCNTKVFI